jgi:hypothetical protein
VQVAEALLLHGADPDATTADGVSTGQYPIVTLGKKLLDMIGNPV